MKWWLLWWYWYTVMMWLIIYWWTMTEGYWYDGLIIDCWWRYCWYRRYDAVFVAVLGCMMDVLLGWIGDIRWWAYVTVDFIDTSGRWRGHCWWWRWLKCSMNDVMTLPVTVDVLLRCWPCDLIDDIDGDTIIVLVTIIEWYCIIIWLLLMPLMIPWYGLWWLLWYGDDTGIDAMMTWALRWCYSLVLYDWCCDVVRCSGGIR